MVLIKAAGGRGGRLQAEERRAEEKQAADGRRQEECGRHCPIAIIGGGISGITAAIQLRRFGLDPLLFEGGVPGGLLLHAFRLDNFPGFPKGIGGPDLAARMIEQMKRFQVRVTPERVERLSFRSGIFRLRTRDGSYSADRVIVASGTRPKPYPIALHAAKAARRHLFDSILPLRGRRGMRMAVIGASDAAYDYALQLAACNRVWILGRSACSRAIAPLAGAAGKHPDITVLQGVTVREISLRGKALRIDARRDGKRFELEVDAAVTAIGRDPETGFLSPWLRPRVMELNAAGRLWLAGDVVRGRMRQASIAAGDGMRAAMELWNALAEA